MIRFERRAATVLYNLLGAQPRTGPVLVPENICPVVVLVLRKLGYEIETVDLSLQTMAMDHDRLLQRWSSSIRSTPSALIYVRPYGYVEDLSGVFRMLRDDQPEALIIDDRCLGFPDPMAAPDYGVDAVLFSSGYSKCVDLGWGGFAVTKPLTAYWSSLGGYDKNADHHWAEVAKSAIASQQWLAYEDSDWLDRRSPGPWEEHRAAMAKEEPNSREIKRRLNAIYGQSLPVRIQFPSALNQWRFNIWVESSERLLTALQSHGLFASSHYRSIAPLLGGKMSAACAALGCHAVNLFNYKYVDVDTVEHTVDVLRRQPDLLRPGPVIAALNLGG